MKRLILGVLEEMSHGPINIGLRSPHFREVLAKKILNQIGKKTGWYLNLNTFKPGKNFLHKNSQKETERNSG